MDYSPIETHYNGYRFRSRTEARWAVFFNEIGIKYQYEPEGFKRECSEEETYCYLPDFYFPDENVYAEVKGTNKALFEDADKLAAMIDYGGPMANGLLILGEIPNYSKMGWGNIPMFSFLENSHKGIVSEYATFFPHTKGITFEKYIAHIMDLTFTCEDIPDFSFDDIHRHWGDFEIPTDTSVLPQWTYDSLSSSVFEEDASFQRLKRAYQKARQARFEHGEKG